MAQTKTLDRRVVKTRRAIKNALTELILEKDSPKITVTEIAERADIDRKTFYLHYESINDIVRDISKEKLDELEKKLSGHNFFDDSFDINILFEALNETISDDIELYRHIAKNPGYSSFWDEAKAVVEAAILKKSLSQVQATPQELNLYAEYLSSGIMSVYTKWLRGELDLPQKQIAKTVVTLSYYGINSLSPLT